MHMYMTHMPAHTHTPTQVPLYLRSTILKHREEEVVPYSVVHPPTSLSPLRQEADPAVCTSQAIALWYPRGLANGRAGRRKRRRTGRKRRKNRRRKRRASGR